MAGAAKAFGVAHIVPVGRLVDGARKPLRVNKGLQQQYGDDRKLCCQSAQSLFWHKDRMREAKFGKCQSGRIRKRLLLVNSFSRSY